jgi:hypothetical protein
MGALGFSSGGMQAAASAADEVDGFSMVSIEHVTQITWKAEPLARNSAYQGHAAPHFRR